jgi:hypothetical protein
MKTKGAWKYSSTILNLDRFTPGEIAQGIHWIGGWVGLTSGLAALEKRVDLPLPRIKRRTSSPHPVAVLTEER